jgi:phage terminase large subunit GpA-like protein
MPELAVYICEHCHGEIQNHEQHWILAEGEWRAAEPGAGRAAGFHLSSLYSPVGWFSWANAAALFEEAFSGAIDGRPQ